jgi:HD-GYP domain-containing protein (c-di-GMP phosphodiesterase class II)
MAASHHERLDGTGYHRGTAASRLDLGSRVICVADICDALLATRPYRAGLAPERALEILRGQVGTAIDGDCYRALQASLGSVLGDRALGDVPAVRLDGGLAEDYQQAA